MSNIKNLPGLELYSNSPVAVSAVEFALAKRADGAQIAVFAPAGAAILADFEGETSEQAGKTLLLGPTSPRPTQLRCANTCRGCNRIRSACAPRRGWATGWGWRRPATCKR